MRPNRKWATAVAALVLILTVVGTASAATVSTVYSNIPIILPGTSRASPSRRARHPSSAAWSSWAPARARTRS